MILCLENSKETRLRKMSLKAAYKINIQYCQLIAFLFVNNSQLKSKLEKY